MPVLPKWFVVAAFLSAGNAWSQTQPQRPPFTSEEIEAALQDPPAYTIDEKTITIEKAGPAASPAELAPPAQDPGDDTIPMLDKIVNIAQKIWGIIEKNKPVVNVKTQYATALPEGIKSWSQLGSWKPAKGAIYGFSAKNLYGITVVKVRYQVLRTYGGSYKGKGQYLTAVTVEPLLVEVAWGYHFDLSVEVPDSGIVNVGTTGDPVAAMLAILKWQIETPLKDSQGKGVYYMQGDGLYQELGGPFKRDFQDRVPKSLARALPRGF